MKYQLAQVSVTGGRQENQDRIACVERDNAIFMVLGDGLGGHEGGALASTALVETLVRSFEKTGPERIENPHVFITLSVLHAHRVINTRARSAGLDNQPRTTCVACLVQDGYAYWGHVGDSRLYHFRGQRLRSRTRDHTTVEMLRADGLLSEQAAKPGKFRNSLMKCVGGPQRPKVSLGDETRLMLGDSLILCSDGVWQGSDEDTLAHLSSETNLENAVEKVVLDIEARLQAAADNLSMIVLRWDDKVTTAPPLNPTPAEQLDQDELWRRHKQRMAQQKLEKHPARVARQTAASAGSDVDAIQNAIDEIEAFIKRIEGAG